ncbi:MAG: LysM peptidoglycan-binding domain-containing protein [Caldilineales bacterium]|nr:LysM peptidoglycan-binding domain-containing protein [Caldilineales bacterium]
MKTFLFRSFLLIFVVWVGLGWQAHGVQAAEGPIIHTVQSGETLSNIAARYGVAIADLLRLNNLSNANRILAGQRLVIRPATGGTGAAPGGGTMHIVRRGETLSGIAAAHGVTVAALKQANGLRSNTIFIGQRLRLPGDGAAPSGGQVVHVVQRGETLSAIAARYNVSVQQIIERNGIANASLISVGQRLVISGSAPAAPANPAPSGPKLIVVDISEQRCWQYQGDVQLNVWRCSTGMNNATRTGTFRVQSKLRKAYGSTWNIWMPYWLGIYWAGGTENGFHGIPWNADSGRKIWAGLVGTPATYGCVMLKDAPMEELWNWADIGTKVVIRR